MKKILLGLVILFLVQSVKAQNPGYQDRLYYTCKVWGFIKYYHSWVSNCQVNWDKVLLKILPMVKSAQTTDEFNDVLDTMIVAAGPMDIATKPLEEITEPELKRNLNFEWINDPVFRNNTKDELIKIRDNFRPHEICWIKMNDGSGYGYLAFPYDYVMLNQDLYDNFPDEYSRLMLIFKYWNILSYFNPYKYSLDEPWDSTLYNNILQIANADEYGKFFLTYKKMSAALNDAHTEGLTWSRHAFILGNYYRPLIIIDNTKDEYVIRKSGYPEIAIGDVVVSIDDMSIKELEDSLRPYVSAGNPNVFRRFISTYMFLGDSGTTAKIGIKNSTGNINYIEVYRNFRSDTFYTNYYPNDTLGKYEWLKWDNNVGYVNMGIMKINNVSKMYEELQNTKAIIFDLRIYPAESVITSIANIIYPDRRQFVKFTEPDLYYPGTFQLSSSSYGKDGNTNAYKGKVIILCNHKTQSHAEFCCMALKAMPNSVIVGSQTAGADGNITGFYLGTDIQAGYTSLGVYYPNGDSTQRIGIVPDSVVFPTAESIRQGRDLVLEKALEIAGNINNVEEITIQIPDYILPNPATDFIRLPSVDVENSRVEIYTVNGLLVYLGKYSVQIEVGNLAPGLYFLKLNDRLYKFIRQ